MFKPLIHFVLQHLMQQNSWTAPLLQPYANQSICIDFKVAQATLAILENGALTMAADSVTQPDATIHLPPSLVMRLLRKDPSAHQLVKIDGNIEMATAVSKVLTTIRWDIEGDLSKVVGDIAAFQIVEISQNKIQRLSDNAKNIGEMLLEYFQEERPLLAKKSAIEHFNQAVDTLRGDTDRLEARIHQLLEKNKLSEVQD